jgi:hypothetical protein
VKVVENMIKGVETLCSLVFVKNKGRSAKSKNAVIPSVNRDIEGTECDSMGSADSG